MMRMHWLKRLMVRHTRVRPARLLDLVAGGGAAALTLQWRRRWRIYCGENSSEDLSSFGCPYIWAQGPWLPLRSAFSNGSVLTDLSRRLRPLTVGFDWVMPSRFFFGIYFMILKAFRGRQTKFPGLLEVGCYSKRIISPWLHGTSILPGP